MTNHAKISYIKSGVRLIGYGIMGYVSTFMLFPAILLTIAEIIGIVEEVGN